MKYRTSEWNGNEPDGPYGEPAGDKFPEPGVSKDRPKYSAQRDYMIGSRNGTGNVNDNANETRDWSQEDTASTGLITRQPL